MTSASARRLAKLEGALHPQEAVLAWLAEAQQFASIIDHARAIAALPVAAAPLSVIGARVVAAVRAERKGQPRDEVERAALRAQGDAVFLFCLVAILNRRVFEVAELEGLRAAGAFWWMGALMGGPHEPPGSAEDANERRDAWRNWRTLIERLTADVRVETEARACLERRYLGGHAVLFPDAAAALTATANRWRASLASPSSRATSSQRSRRGGGRATGTRASRRSPLDWRTTPG